MVISYEIYETSLLLSKEMIKYIINYTLYVVHYDAYFQINDDAKKCRYLSVTNKLIFSLIIHLNCCHMKH